MRLLHWCMLGVTILLLVCEVAISRLCNSLITLVDGFHTLFILLHVALLHPPTSSIINNPLPSLDSSPSPPHASSSSSSAAPPPVPPAESPAESPPVGRGVSFSSSRIQPVGAFISALFLTSLCLSYFLEIISFSLEPHPVQRPLLPVVVGAVGLLHKLLFLWLNWDWLQNDAGRRPQSDAHLEGNHKGSAAEETRGSQAGPGRVLDDYYGALVLSNPGTSGVSDTESQAARQQPVHLHPAAHGGCRGCEAACGTAHMQTGKWEYRSEDPMETHKDNTCMGHLDNHNASPATVYNSSRHIETTVPSRRGTAIVPSFVLVVQGICPALLALVNSLAMLLIRPRVLHSSEACGLLLYLDPLLSLLAVIMLIATAAPQVHRYGLLLLQATPSHICASDLGRRIAGVPGVQAVHNLHVWQLTESFSVASVHVHCHTGFPVHRCADLMSGVTKVMQSVGVSCCTVQPEFALCSGSCAGSEGDASPVIHREDPSLPPPLTCNLACGRACAGFMCCSTVEEETGLMAPPAGETKEEPQTLVIENTFL